MPRRLSSSCRQFRRLHVEYVDGLLSNEAQLACRAHLDECPVCSMHDVRIRRSLLALQALPTIDVSDTFHDRLCERLSQETLHYTPGKPAWVRRMMAAAIVAAATALYATASHTRTSTPTPVQPIPAVARAPEAPPQNVMPAARPVRATTSSPRFEALSGPSLRPPMLQAPHLQSVRLQAVNYLGQ